MSKMRIAGMQPISDDTLQKVAAIIGTSSAADLALAERERRRALGENVGIFLDRGRGVIFVGPAPEEG